MQVRGKSAIVTGAGVRLGRAIALRLAAEGMHVCLHYHGSAEQVRETQALAAASGVKACTVRADFSEPCAAAERVVRQANDALGPIEVLVNSAAIFEPGGLAETDERVWDRHLDINLKGPVFLAREFVRQLPEEGDRIAHLINIADWRALRPGVGYLAYTIAKSGLVTLTRILAQELGPRVHVNAIAPGPILPAPGDTEAAFEARGATVPLRKTGHPDDVTEAVVFLLRSEFITGEVLHVSGGEELPTRNP